MYNDHKKEPGKSRPIVRGNSGNTRGLINSVSNLLESVANSIPNTFEHISSEDMLFSTKEANKKIVKIKKEWREKRSAKLKCTTCNYKAEPKTHCHTCEEEISDCEQEDGQDLEVHKMETKYDCDNCGQEWRARMEADCEECGPGIFWEDQEICLIELDVVPQHAVSNHWQNHPPI